MTTERNITTETVMMEIRTEIEVLEEVEAENAIRRIKRRRSKSSYFFSINSNFYEHYNMNEYA